MPVSTAKVEGHRDLDFKSFDELLADTERMSSGRVNALGNWSVGQVFRHLAMVMNCSIDSFNRTFRGTFD